MSIYQIDTIVNCWRFVFLMLVKTGYEILKG